MLDTLNRHFLTITKLAVEKGICSDEITKRYLTVRHLRNEFHFSGVHGAMNRSGSRAK